jgi:hypothetical protein
VSRLLDHGRDRDFFRIFKGFEDALSSTERHSQGVPGRGRPLRLGH